MADNKPSVEKIYSPLASETAKDVLIRLRSRITDGFLLSMVQSSRTRFAVLYAKVFLVVALVQSLVFGTLPRWEAVAGLTIAAMALGGIGRWIAIVLVSRYYPTLNDDDFEVQDLSGWDAIRAVAIMVLPCACAMGCLGFALAVWR